ncbi:MAG: hypothetical protein J0H88_18420 [Sphingomonadales bacterium]|nr:hypothetical protein [Sphingomonadales bacterium]
MQILSIFAALAAAYQLAPASAEMENCNDDAQYGPFKISVFLHRGGDPGININYRIPRSHIGPTKDDLGRDGPNINFGFRAPLSGDGYHSIHFYNFRKLFGKERFPVHAMTFVCGKGVTLIGDTSIQPYPLNGIFVRESLLRGRECMRSLRRSGYYKISFEELEGPKRAVRIEGKADFAGVIDKAERMARHRSAMAKAGRCILNPPPPPPT